MMRPPGRLRRHARRLRWEGGLNLVSLMDIFTILVLFLLVQSTVPEVFPTTRGLELPLSTARDQPRPTPTVYITPEAITVEGEAVLPTREAAQAPGQILPSLVARLHQLQEAPVSGLQPQVHFRGWITILAHREIPFSLLRKVLESCSQAGYTQISLAVLQKEGS